MGSETIDTMKTPTENGAPSAPLYWTTTSEYHRDEEYLSRVGEEFFPDAKPERYFEAEGQDEKLLSPMKRRTFLKLSGFAALAAMIQGCERPVQHLLPYVNKPEEITFGTPNFYMTTWGERGEGYGLMVRAREGRPIKLEGNPAHPINLGKLDVRGQSTILDLYNPDRLRFPIKHERQFRGPVGESLKHKPEHTMEVLDQEVGEAIRVAKANGRKVVLLTPTVSGPSNDRLLSAYIGEGANFEHVVYDSLNTGDERSAYAAAFGDEVTPRYVFENADVVVCLGGDPMAQGPSPLGNQVGIGKRRFPDAEGGMSRLYTFESVPSLTGTNSDYRYPVHPAQLVPIGLAIANILVESGQLNTNVRGVEQLLSGYAPSRVAAESGVAEAELRRVAASLLAHPGRSIIYTQGVASATADYRQLQLVGILINALLGNYENTIDLTVSRSRQANGSTAGLARLVREMNDGQVAVLLIEGVNPVYTTPESVGFAAAMEKVGLIVSLSRMMDETAAGADIAIPGVHPLEAWGDAQPEDGLFCIQQPVIRKIFGEIAADTTYMSRSWQESVMAFLTASGSNAFTKTPTREEIDQLIQDAGVQIASELDPALLEPKAVTWYDFVQETWQQEVFERGDFGDDFTRFWQGLLHKGFLDLADRDRRGPFRVPSLRSEAFAGIRPSAAAQGTVLVAYPTNYHGDGVSMGNPFLLELSDPVSKISWDNHASMSPKMAESLGVKDGDMVRITAGGTSIEIPAYVQPGTHGSVVAVMLGWGRKTFGGVGDGIGVNVYPLLGSREDGGVVFSGLPVTVERGSGSTVLANIQGHNYLFSPVHGGIKVNAQHGDIPENAQLNEDGDPVYDRPIIGETTLNEWKKDPFSGYPNATEHGQLPKSIWEATHKYVGHHWGMTIDMNACTGCGACVVACQIENNIPVVGKEEVAMGREMHWMRIDRYYRGDFENPEFVHQPMLCQHCDNAPCETVCPVVATAHNDEGLNVMTYNRCVGTRYCANNCPYKVRRFNFWQYSDFRTGPKQNIKRISPLEMVLNPDVTTRSRGVMEKCTFCIHRIRNAKEDAREQQRKLEDADLQTACQQTCPANAIQFGDRNNPNAQVAQLWKNPRSYGVLTDLSTDPSIMYMTKVRNQDDPSPYRTKYQAHRLHKKHAKAGAHDDHAHENDHH